MKVNQIKNFDKTTPTKVEKGLSFDKVAGTKIKHESEQRTQNACRQKPSMKISHKKTWGSKENMKQAFPVRKQIGDM